jgi:hypothetical protein
MPRRAAAGFSLVELMIVGLILSLILGMIAAIATSSERAYETGSTAAHLERQVAIAMDRVVAELRIANLTSITPDPVPGLGASSVQFVKAEGSVDGEPIWSPLRSLAFEYEQGELDDGLDNNSNGLVDEGRVVLTEDIGGAGEMRIVLTRWVPELFEGELPNGLDDNGNTFIDERGFWLLRTDETIQVGMSLEKTDAQGRRMTRTGRSSTRVRN